MTDDPRRALPGLDRLLEEAEANGLVGRHPRGRVRETLRALLDETRAGLAEGGPAPPADPASWLERAALRLEDDEVPSLRRVINATGVILHTNLGRAPLADEARAALAEIGTGYANLEFDLDEGGRGSRYAHCAGLLAELTGAEDALVVNNCAAALVLALNTLAQGRGVVVSRGELVEIGGGFRIPDMLARAGTRLVEVGTTNRTRLADYGVALEDGDIGAILKVHRSNFRIEGFTEEVSVEALAALGAEAGVAIVHDVGSGLLVEPERLGLPPEPRAGRSVEAGVDVAVFSGDKLLGGPQAGCVVGKANTVARLRDNPLCRALRVDKGTLAALEATLRLYRDPEAALTRIPTLRRLAEPADAVEARARALAEGVAADGLAGVRVAPGAAVVGGGTLPGHEIPSWTLRVPARPGTGADDLARRLRTGDPPVVGRVEEGEVVLDLRTVAPDEETRLRSALAHAWAAGS